MSNWLIFSLGFLAQLFFTARLFFQWFLSEKSKKVITPSIFWKLSIFGSILLFIYGYLRNDFAIMFGQAITYFIYIRNLHLQGEWQKIPFWAQLVLLFFFPFLIIIYAYNNGVYDLNQLFNNKEIPVWLFYLGVISQLVFIFRFVYQWLYSERKKASKLPIGFWVLSVVGAALIFIYAIFRKDPVLILGQGAGLIIYIRNIIIAKNELKN